MQKKKPKGLIWQTDRGSQYAFESHRLLLAQHRIVQSMSRKGNCWDNAVSESFFHTLKTELVHHENYPTRDEAKKTVFEYIEVFYNRLRLHAKNGYASPVGFESRLKVAVFGCGKMLPHQRHGKPAIGKAQLISL